MAFYYSYEPVYEPVFTAPIYAPASDFGQLRRDVDMIFDSVLRPDNLLLLRDPLLETRGLWSRLNSLLDSYDDDEMVSVSKRPRQSMRVEAAPRSHRRPAARAAAVGEQAQRAVQVAPAAPAQPQSPAPPQASGQPEAQQQAAAAAQEVQQAQPQPQAQHARRESRGEAGPLATSRLWRAAMLEPRVDVLENTGAFVVRAEVPGIAPEDIKLEVAGNVLTLSGELHREESSGERERVHRQERVFGCFSRQFRFPGLQSVSPQEISAEFEHGVLTIKVPKPKSEVPVAIPVRIAGGAAAAEKAPVAAVAAAPAPAAVEAAPASQAA
eukprot:tig00020604_g11848.t1